MIEEKKLSILFVTGRSGAGLSTTLKILEDLVKAAHNNAKLQLKSKTSEELSKAAGGFGIPGFKWPL